MASKVLVRSVSNEQFTQAVEAGKHQLFADEPESFGGSDRGPGPYENLLEFAEDQGVFPDSSCRSGICHSCQYELLKGEVDYSFEPLDPPYPGQVLLCCARPRSNLVIEV